MQCAGEGIEDFGVDREVIVIEKFGNKVLIKNILLPIKI